MGYKVVCLTCRKAFSIGPNYIKPDKCSECGNQFIPYDYKFRPPKRSDLKSWKVVGFLYEHGFTYQHIYKDLKIKNLHAPENYADYPLSIVEAKEFVLKYENQAKQIP